MKACYNNELKTEFIKAMVKSKKSYVQAYEGLFAKSSKMEALFNKDLIKFTSENLLTLFKDVSNNLKYTTVMSYNSLVKNYKDWVSINYPNLEVVEGTCTVEQLSTISNFRRYVMFNDNDMDELTIGAKIDGADYNPIIFLRLFWEIEGQESSNDICKLNINDIDHEKNTVSIYNSKKDVTTTYIISNWLNEIIREFSNKERVQFFNRNGDYDIGTAQDNNGYIFRMTKSSKTNPNSFGIPMSASKMSNILNNYCNTKLGGVVITVNDLLMSLALKHMVTSRKTPLEMNNEKRYFRNIATNIYREVLNTYGQEKYKDEYKSYCKIIKTP